MKSLTLIMAMLLSFMSWSQSSDLIVEKLTSRENIGLADTITVNVLKIVGAKTTLSRKIWFLDKPNGDRVAIGLNNVWISSEDLLKEGLRLVDGVEFESLYEDNKRFNSQDYGCVKSGYGSPSIPFYSEGRSASRSCSSEKYSFKLVYNNGMFDGTFNSKSGWFGHRKREGDVSFTAVKTYDLKKEIYKKYDKQLLYNPEAEEFFFIVVEESDHSKLMIQKFVSEEIVEVTADYFNKSLQVKDLKEIEKAQRVSAVSPNQYVCRDFKSGVLTSEPGYEKSFIHISSIKRKKIEDTPYTRFARIKQLDTDQFQFSGKKWNAYLYENNAEVYLYNGPSNFRFNLINMTPNKQQSYFLLYRNGRGNYRFCVEQG